MDVHLDREVRFERKARPVGRGNAGKETWQEVGTVYAEVQDMLPSRGERLSEGMTMAVRPARIRVRYRDDITSDMRVLVGRTIKDGNGDLAWETHRVLQITGGPAELGRRHWLEMVGENYSTAGGGA
jgi:SPP1 family predicted phage head-tail adaptor